MCQWGHKIVGVQVKNSLALPQFGDICCITSIYFVIRHNKKDGGTLVVKTVLREFALAGCNDS